VTACLQDADGKHQNFTGPTGKEQYNGRNRAQASHGSGSD